MISLDWKTWILIIAGMLFVGVGAIAAYYRGEMKDARKKANLRKARAQALQDSLRTLSTSGSGSTKGKLSFPSEDSLRSYAEMHFQKALQPDESGPRIDGQFRSGVVFDWAPKPAETDSTVTPTQSDSTSSTFEIDLTRRDYELEGTFTATGYQGGSRSLKYQIDVQLKKQTFRLLRSQEGQKEEVYIQSPGTITDLTSYHNPPSSPEKENQIQPRLKGSLVGTGQTLHSLLTGGVVWEGSHFRADIGVGLARDFTSSKKNNPKTKFAGEMSVTLGF